MAQQVNDNSDQKLLQVDDDQQNDASVVCHCKQQHVMPIVSQAIGNCSNCNQSLANKSSRYCTTCDYGTCIACYKLLGTNCTGKHGLTISTANKLANHKFTCDACYKQISINDDFMHSCRICNHDICIVCYVPRTVLYNIDLNCIPLNPSRYDEIFAYNYNKINLDKNDIDKLNSINYNANDIKINDINDIDDYINDKNNDGNEFNSNFDLIEEEKICNKLVAKHSLLKLEIIALQNKLLETQKLFAEIQRLEINKRTKINDIKQWIKSNKLIWESFKLRWKEWDIYCFIEYLKRIKLEVKTFNEYFNGSDKNCQIQIEKYMLQHIDKFKSNIFNGKDHLKLFNELSFFRVGITEDKDCNIICDEIQKLFHKNRKKKKKKTSKKKNVKIIKQNKQNKQNKNIDNDLDDNNDNDDDDDKETEIDTEMYVFLKNIHLEDSYAILAEDGFDDMMALTAVEESDLIQLKMKNGHIKKLLNAVAKYKRRKKTGNFNQIEGQHAHFYISPK